jgi:very-short-patch-repair endonuclease
MDFAEAHLAFIQEHVASRKGERRDRLERGHRHAEQLFLQQVWWPLLGNFQNLHPEYEVVDWHGRAYFADFCWCSGQVKLLIEIKGFQTHVRDMDRRKFSYELNRETFLLAMGFQVVSFSYDDVEQQPQVCQSLLRMVMGRYLIGNPLESRMKLMEREILRYAVQLGRPLRPKDVKVHFQMGHDAVVRTLQSLEAAGWLTSRSGSGGQRTVAYELAARPDRNGLLPFFR